jgi:hypothetical protein
LLRVGNDIVDLTDPHNRGKSRNTRFINRVFTINEQKKILGSGDQDAILWALWAGKESAYKIISKSHSSVPFTPRLYEVILDSIEPIPTAGQSCSGCNYLAGCVDTPYDRVHIRIFVTRNHVHCIGISAPPEAINAVIWQVDHIGTASHASLHSESLLVRETLMKHLSEHIDQCPENIEIIRVRGPDGLSPPRVLMNGRSAGIDISLSHDGLFTAHAFVIQ